MEIIAQLEHMSKMLKNLEGWLDKAAEYAVSRNFDPDVLLAARLAPDQWALARQIQAACDAPKFAAAYLADKPAPVHPDTETTLPEIRQRIAAVLTWLEPFTAADFEGAAIRRVTPRVLRGGAVLGDDYLLHFAVPNFFFHLMMAYAILRHNGVPLSKNDYLGAMPLI